MTTDELDKDVDNISDVSTTGSSESRGSSNNFVDERPKKKAKTKKTRGKNEKQVSLRGKKTDGKPLMVIDLENETKQIVEQTRTTEENKLE